MDVEIGFVSLMRVVKTIILVPVRELLHSGHRYFRFRRALRAFSRDLKTATFTQSWVARDLIYGWGNDAWSASEDYLLACLKYALLTDGPMLECGSGLTTIVLGIVGDIF